MKIIVHEELQNFIIKPYGRFEDGDCLSLEEALEKGIRSHNQSILIDLGDLQNITAAGQRLLLSYAGRLDVLHRLLVLYQVNSSVMESFDASGLAKVITIVPGLNAAKALTTARK